MRTSAVPLLGFAFLIIGIGSGCSSLSTEEEEFLHRHRWFFSAAARQVYVADPSKRDELNATFYLQREEQVRPEYLPAVRNGRVELGMTRTEVLFALGAPNTATSAEVGAQVSEWNEYLIGGERVTLVFDNSVLEAIHEHPAARAGGIGGDASRQKPPGPAPPDEGGSLR